MAIKKVSILKNISPDRITRLRTMLGMSQSEFAKKIGVSRNYVSMLERGAKEVSVDSSIGILFQILEENPKRSDLNPKHSDLILRENPPPYGARGSLREIPVLGWAHAGQAESYEEIPQNWQRHLPTDCRDQKAFAVMLEGDSMEPMFREGDIVVLMPGERIHNGCLAVVRLVSDGVLLRRIEMRGERMRLVPLNPRYEADEMGQDEILWAYPVWGRWTPIWKPN
jgi:SOS-response transcriptional repressor LexA